jgi:hypothetical protein
MRQEYIDTIQSPIDSGNSNQRDPIPCPRHFPPPPRLVQLPPQQQLPVHPKQQVRQQQMLTDPQDTL